MITAIVSLALVRVFHHLDRYRRMKLALMGVFSGCFLASIPVEANSLHPCGSIRIANTTFCFIDANRDGKYQEGNEEFCLDGWVTRGGLRCREQGGVVKPASDPSVLRLRVLTNWDESCSGSMSIDEINDYLRGGYKITGANTHTEVQQKDGQSIACSYTTYSLQKR